MDRLLPVSGCEPVIAGPFTGQQDPAVEAGIAALLAHLIQAIPERLAGAGIDSISLRGAMAAGEATALLQAGQLCLLSDIDLAVHARDCPSPTAMKSLSAELSRETGALVQIEAALAAPEAPHGMLLRQVDDFSRRKLLWGQAMPEGTAIDPTHIPASEGVFLVFNRVVGLLASVVRGAPPCPDQWYQTVKTVLAVGDALLIYRHNYRTHLAAKLSAVQELAAESGLIDFLPYYLQAAAWKLRPPSEWMHALQWIQPAWRASLQATLDLESRRMDQPLANWLEHSIRFAQDCSTLAPVSALGRWGAIMAICLNWQAYGPPVRWAHAPNYRLRGDCMLVQAAFLLFESRCTRQTAELERALALLNLRPTGQHDVDWECACRRLVETWQTYVL